MGSKKKKKKEKKELGRLLASLRTAISKKYLNLQHCVNTLVHIQELIHSDDSSVDHHEFIHELVEADVVMDLFISLTKVTSSHYSNQIELCCQYIVLCVKMLAEAFYSEGMGMAPSTLTLMDGEGQHNMGDWEDDQEDEPDQDSKFRVRLHADPCMACQSIHVGQCNACWLFLCMLAQPPACLLAAWYGMMDSAPF